jgi:tRNA (guanine37-N1)-methyltransferase
VACRARNGGNNGLSENMQVGLVTLFPGMFSALTEYGVTGRAIRNRQVNLRYWNPRDFTTDKHRTVDDRPYGGGPGMLMKTGPLTQAIQAAKHAATTTSTSPRVVYLSPQGKPLDQATVIRLAQQAQTSGLVLLCGRYEGVDERLLTTQVDEECSLGDFVLSGGELAAMALLDAIIRRLPGVLGDAESALQDSFEDGLLDHPQYTRPEVFEGQAVPEVLLSGDHARIARWRAQQRLKATWRKRPDIVQKLQQGGALSREQQTLLESLILEGLAEGLTREGLAKDDGGNS